MTLTELFEKITLLWLENQDNILHHLSSNDYFFLNWEHVPIRKVLQDFDESWHKQRHD